MPKEISIPAPSVIPDAPHLHYPEQDLTNPSDHFDAFTWPSHLHVQVNISRLFQEARTIQGIYLDVEKLDALDFRARLARGSALAELQRTVYQNNLFHWELNALAHLCLPLAYHDALEQQGVVTLSQLRSLVQAQRLHQLDGIGVKATKRITILLRQWEGQALVIWRPDDDLLVELIDAP